VKKEVIGDKYMYVTYYVRLGVIKEVTVYKNTRRGKLQNTPTCFCS